MSDIVKENMEMILDTIIMVIAYTVMFVVMIISIFILAFMSIFVYETNRVKEMVMEMRK